MTRHHTMRLAWAIVALLTTLAPAAAATPDPNDADKYLNTVREYGPGSQMGNLGHYQWGKS